MKTRNLDKDKIKESLTSEDVKLIVSDLGGSYSRDDMSGNPQFTTICHGGDSNKLYYYEDSASFHCYTHCGHMDVYQLVTQIKGRQGTSFSFPDALGYVAQLTGKTFTTQESFGKQNNKIEDWDWINKFKSRPKRKTGLKEYCENVLEVFAPYIHYSWYREGISKKSARIFEIGYYFKEDQIVIPHRSIEGGLVGIRSRNLDERVDSGMKYIPTIVGNTQYRHIVNYNLYGAHKTKHAISRFRKCLIFEGEKSVLKAEDQFGEDNFTVAVGGSNISSHQRDLILNLGVSEVFIAFDNFREQMEKESDLVYEKATLAYQKKLVRLAHLFTPYVQVYILWDYKGDLDPNDAPIDKGEDVFIRLMQEKIEIKSKEEVED